MGQRLCLRALAAGGAERRAHPAPGRLVLRGKKYNRLSLSRDSLILAIARAGGDSPFASERRPAGTSPHQYRGRRRAVSHGEAAKQSVSGPFEWRPRGEQVA